MEDIINSSNPVLDYIEERIDVMLAESGILVGEATQKDLDDANKRLQDGVAYRQARIDAKLAEEVEHTIKNFNILTDIEKPIELNAGGTLRLVEQDENDATFELV